MTDVDRRHVAVLVIRLWFEAYPSPSTLRARMLCAEDPTGTGTSGVVVAGVQPITEEIASWLASYVAKCEGKRLGEDR